MISRTAASLGGSVFAELQPVLREMEARGERVIPLHLGDTHVLPPEPARLEAVAAALAARPQVYGYGSIGGTRELLGAVAAVHRTTESRVLIGAGATHALF